jgi:hypothetical protein
MTLSRISITVSGELVEAADGVAARLDRSRSWVVAEALRRYLSEVGESDSGRSAAAIVREAASTPYAQPDLGEYRRAQLEADLALTPEQRVREAEETARLSEVSSRDWQGDRVLMFDRYEDYLAWERWADLTSR